MKINRKSLLISSVLLFFLSTGAIFAQKKAKPDFSGTWVLDEDKSRGVFDSKLDKFSVLYPNQKKTDTIIIEHLEPKIALTEKRLIERFDGAGGLIGKDEAVLSSLVFFTDKRGESNVFGSNVPPQWSATAWSGKDILISLKQGDKKKNASMLMFSLSKDGKELEIKNMIYEIKFDESPRSPGIRTEYSVSTAAGGKKVYKKVE